MDMSSATGSSSWFATLDLDEEMEDPMVLQDFVRDCLVDSPINYSHCNHSLSSSSESNGSTATPDLIAQYYTTTTTATYVHHQKPDTADPWSPSFRTNDNDIPYIIQTELDPDLAHDEDGLGPTTKTITTTATAAKKKGRRKAEHCHNHIIAERQRRRNLSQGFIALSALVPGLKKMDKTSILGEAINHMKELKERVKMLQESENSKKSGRVESGVLVKRSQVIVPENEPNSSSSPSSSVHDDSYAPSDEQLPEIEARFSDKDVLIKIHCQKQKGILIELINQIEQLHLSVITTNAIPFNHTNFDITVMAKMDPEFDMSPQDVLRSLRSVFQ